LGTVAIQLTTKFTDPYYWGSDELAFDLGFRVIESHPYLNVYGKMEERFIELLKVAKEYDLQSYCQ
jgi:hypothetical protein